MKHLTLKMIACILLAAVLLGCVSCELLPPHDDESSTEMGEKLRLTVEEVQVLYTSEETDLFCARLTKLVCDIVYLREKVVLNQKQQKSVSDYVRSSVMPMLSESRVTADELDRLCTLAESTLDGTVQIEAEALCNGYRECIAILGNERVGAILYESILLWLDRQIAICDERYEKYHYAWYLEDGDRYRAQRTGLTEQVGRESFSVMSGFWFFTLSAAVSGVRLSDGGSLLADAEILALFRRQAAYFNGRELTAEQWGIVTGILGTCFLADVTLPKTMSASQKGVLTALQKDANYAARIGEVMPSALALYESVVNALRSEDIAVLREQDEAACSAVICRALAADRTAFLNFADDCLRNAASAEESQAAALRKAGTWEAYSAYAEEQAAVTPEVFFAYVQAVGADANEQTLAQLRSAGESFLFGMLPYVTFAFCAEGSD